jgi:peptidoglycan/LPS O-acetylase OafA/YrhL
LIQYRSDIDGLRALAVLAVVIFHAFPEFLPGGFIGVDIFFVISGFLISGIIYSELKTGRFSFIDFYSRRIRRIFPALLLVLLAATVFGWFILLADEYSQLGKHIAAGSAFLSNLFFWQEAGYFDNSASTKPFLHLWSLGIEEQYYIFWPLLLWLGFRIKLNLGLLTLAIALISFGLNIRGFTVSHDTVATFYSPQTRFWELLFGALLAYHYIKIEPVIRQLANSLSIAGLLLIVVGLVIIHPNYSFPGWWALLPTLGAVLLIAAGPAGWVNKQFLSNVWMVRLGLISYPLYLWHWVCLSFLFILSASKPSLSNRLIVVAISVILSYLTFRFIEKPIRFGKNKQFYTIVLVFLMFITGISGLVIFQQNGLEFRSVAKVFQQSFEPRLAIKASCDKELDIAFQGYCNTYDGIDKASILLIGDSFSYALGPALESLRAQTGKLVTQVGKGSCPLLDGYGVNDCLKDGIHVNKVLNTKDNIKTVLISANYVFYSENSKDKTWTEKDFSRNSFLGAFDKTIEAHLKKGREVVVFLTIPHGIDPKSCVIRPLSLSIDVCKAPMRPDIDSANVFLAQHLKEKFPTVTVVDPISTFCKDGECVASNGKDKTYYFDGWHLNRFGAEALFEQNQDAIKAKVK